jgi:simple sugar transport system permease protein
MTSRFSDRELNFLVAINVVILVVATVLSKGDFLDVYNFQSMGGQLPELGLLAMGVALSMISGNGGIDLSGVALANLAGVVAATVAPMLAAPDASPWLYTAWFAVIALAVGLVGGLLNGVLIARPASRPSFARWARSCSTPALRWCSRVAPACAWATPRRSRPSATRWCWACRFRS